MFSCYIYQLVFWLLAQFVDMICFVIALACYFNGWLLEESNISPNGYFAPARSVHVPCFNMGWTILNLSLRVLF